MNKINKYEQVYVNLTWIFILLAFVQMLIRDNFLENLNLVIFDKICTNCAIVFLIFILAFNLFKIYLLKKDLFYNKPMYNLLRLIEIAYILFSVIIIGFQQWVYILLVFPILIITLEKGKGRVRHFLIFSLILSIIFQGIKIYSNPQIGIGGIYFYISTIVFLHAMLLIFSELCGKIHEDNYESQQQNKMLLSELTNRYRQLEDAQKEIKIQNDKLRDTNLKMEDTNRKLTESLAELYTVQQISEVINSIFDIQKLLQNVNDIIIGVMGVKYSTILMYDEKKNIFKIHTTNISDQKELIIINDNINCEILLGSLNSGEPLIENFVNPKEFPFVENRGINSLMCIPLITRPKKFEKTQQITEAEKIGLVLIEHKLANAFDNNNLRLMNVIGRQVGIAMENAALYERMNEIATFDNLTKIYNRLSFQEKLEEEFESAKRNNYPLSLAIFDIDHFKKFNDTYGHLFGDKVLKHIAAVIKNSLRSGDIFARFGGEEFIILFPKTDIERAAEKVESLRQKLEETTIKDELVSASVTVSFGISCYPYFASTQSELIKTADDALYRAKEAGRNCVKLAVKDKNKFILVP
jgi:diguanylate cyclase (GGDEF)-like protein